MSVAHLSIAFFFQIFLILLSCKLVGYLGQKYLKQPQVVCEMVAGVLLGPSLFGLIAPEFQKQVFTADTKGILYVGAQLGVGLYMFIVGLGFSSEHFRAKARSAISVSFAGIAFPFILAIVLAPLLLREGGLFTEKATYLHAILFLGAAMAITAFPMLARIIHERGLSDTPIGTLALSAGAIDDAVAWCVLAVVLAAVGGGSTGGALVTIGGGVIFALLMIKVAPKMLEPLQRTCKSDGVSTSTLSTVLMLFALAAFIADAIGLHAVFGGFLLGVVMPRGYLTEQLKSKLEPVTVTLLLPMFFTFSGLNTQLFLATDLALLPLTLLVIFISIIAKFVGCWLAARICGQDNRTALGIGVLMNSRGLMELIIINIGLQAGIISPALFSMLALMAIITTLMTSPLFMLLYGDFHNVTAKLKLGST